MQFARLALPALVLMLATASAGAEEKHHPPGADAPKAADAQTPEPVRPGMGMMGQGMMGSGVMPGGGPGAQLLAPARIEGRIAYLRAELAVTSAQEAAFTALATALRTSESQTHAAARGPGGRMRMGGMTPPARPAAASDTLLERMAHEEHLAASRLDALKGVRIAYEALDKQLTAEQRKTAETLVPLLFPGVV